MGLSPTRAPPPLLSQKSWFNSLLRFSDQNLLLRLSATRSIQALFGCASDAQVPLNEGDMDRGGLVRTQSVRAGLFNSQEIFSASNVFGLFRPKHGRQPSITSCLNQAFERVRIARTDVSKVVGSKIWSQTCEKSAWRKPAQVHGCFSCETLRP